MQLIACLFHVLIIISTAYVTWRYRFNEKNRLEPGRLFYFERYFTTLSNQLSAIASIVYLICVFTGRTMDGTQLPTGVGILLHVSTVAVMVTFLTVMFFLGPMYGFKPMLAGTELYMHLFGPLFAFFANVFFVRSADLPMAAMWLGALPVVLYGIVYLRMVVFLGKEKGGWEDFYGFNQGGRWPLSVSVMYAGSLILSFAIWMIHNAVF